MYIHSDTMSKTVVEVFSISSFFNDASSSSVHFMSCHAWFDHRDSCLLRFKSQVVDFFFEVIWFPNSHCTRHIRGVAIDHTTKVKEEKRIVFELVTSGNSMRICGIVSCQYHGLKAHFLAEAFNAKVNFSDDIRFSFIKRNGVKTKMNRLVCILASDQHFLNFIC